MGRYPPFLRGQDSQPGETCFSANCYASIFASRPRIGPNSRCLRQVRSRRQGETHGGTDEDDVILSLMRAPAFLRMRIEAIPWLLAKSLFGHAAIMLGPTMRGPGYGGGLILEPSAVHDLNATATGEIRDLRTLTFSGMYKSGISTQRDNWQQTLPSSTSRYLLLA
jgi:hypothetical protein